MSTRPVLPVHVERLGLTRNPFPLTPDACAYFRAGAVEQRFVEVLHCIEARKGFVLVTGEIGTGKTTLLRRLIPTLQQRGMDVALVFNTFLQGRELLAAILRDLRLPASGDPAKDVECLNAFLLDNHGRGRTTVLVIDDAQNLNADSLELIRLLSNLETSQTKLVQILLCGQPELAATLARPELRQLASRISLHVRPQPFSVDECARYVDFRLAVSGADGRIVLGSGAARTLYRLTRGNPRHMHHVLDRALYGLVATGERRITPRLLRAAATELDLSAAAARATRRQPWRWALAGVAVAATLWAAGEFGLDVAAAHRPDLAPAALAPAIPTPAATAATAATEAAADASAPPAAAAEAGEEGMLASALQRVATGRFTPSTPALCIREMGAGRWHEALTQGLDSDHADTLAAALADDGWLLARLPEGAAAALPPDGTCVWRTGEAEWALAALTPAASGERGLDPQVRELRRIQAQLAAIGFYAAPIDGLPGPFTRDAIARFLAAQGLPAADGLDPWARFLLNLAAAQAAKG